MKDQYKTKKQLIDELAILRDQLVEFKKTEAGHKRTKEALRREQIKAQHYLDIAEVILVALDKKGKITLINRKGSQILGYKEGELLGKNWITTCLPSPFRKDVKSVFLKLMAGEERVTEFYENPVITRSGRKRIIAWHNTILRDGQGNIIGTLSSGEDITERKRAEEELHESKNFLQDIFDGIQDGISVIDRNLTITKFNKWIEEMHHKDMPLIGKKCYEAYQKRKTVCPWCPSAKALSTGKAHVEDVRVPFDDGSFWWCELSAYPLRGENDDVVGVIEHIKDITERKQAEEKLLESESRYRTLFDSASDAVFILDPTTALFIDANQVACERLGYSREEIVQMTAPDIDSPEYAPLVRERIETLRQVGHLFFETAQVRRDGTIIPTELSSRIITHAGKPAILSIARDITERKQAEARAEHLKFVLLAIRGVNQLITQEKDRDRLIQGICDKLIETRGYYIVWIALIDESGKVAATAEAGLGGDFLPLLERLEHGEPPYCMHTAMERAGTLIIEYPFSTCVKCPLSNGYSGRRAMAVRLKHDEKIYGVITVSVLGDYVADEEEKILFEEVAEDIAFALYSIELEEKRRRAAVAMQESDARFRKLVETMKVGLGAIDEKGVLTYVNEYFSTMLGYTIDEMIGRSTLEFYYDKESRKTQEEIFAKRRAGMRDPAPYEVTWKKRNGQKVYSILSPTPSFDANGRYTGSFGIHIDITERKRAEDEREALREQLRQSQKIEAIGRLAGSIAHDFNNLLTIIKGYSQLSLIDLKEDTPLKENIEQINRATDKAATFVRQVLVFSRRQILEMKVLDLNAILTNLDNMLRRLIGEDIELITILAEDLGRVKTDLSWIEQTIMNLVVNARDAMPSGGKLTIETGNADLDEDAVRGRIGMEAGRYVMLSVKDTGLGMSPDVRERLFEPFFTTKEKDKGTGLGLSTVYGIVKQSGGDIWVYSEPGKGSTFKIYLPGVDDPVEERIEKGFDHELLRGTETILLAEDEENVRELTLRLLERQGYKVLAACNGYEALEVCKQHKDPIHLLLTDVVMPEMNGHELAKRLESLRPEMKVLYMSGYTDNAIVRQGVLVEGVNFIPKPFTVDALTKKIREVLEQ